MKYLETEISKSSFIKNRRIELGMTQTDFAKKLGVCRVTASNIEKRTDLFDILEALELHIEKNEDIPRSISDYSTDELLRELAGRIWKK